ncbi:hypothetical protein PQZ09_00150 [Methylophilaceae bacterium]|nr:hypothetical protein [Methylophilaceae bacterium]
MKHLIFILFFFSTQAVHANWITFYDSQIFEAKLLLSSVQQDEQKTKALIALTYKEKLFSDGVGSQVIFLEHVCGETNPTILEENFYEGKVNKSDLMTIDDDLGKFKKYVKKALPNLIKQICI